MVLLKNYLKKDGKAKLSLNGFIEYIKKMLNTTERKNAIVCSSIHQAKGSETDNVFVLNEAKPTINNLMTPEQKQQEYNLSYVSLTRAKKNLYLVEMPKTERKGCYRSQKEDEDLVDDYEIDDYYDMKEEYFMDGDLI